MKKIFFVRRILWTMTLALTLLIAPKITSAQVVSFQVFYSSLSPYGQWVNVADYGMCWRPVGMPIGWRPYAYGHWVWTEYGWTWVSNYPWGWAPFHYGRWMSNPELGWVWVPGYVWAPAWVQWRWGGGYVGWAPMPPGFHFRVDVVVRGNNDDFGVAVGGWNFVRAGEITSTNYTFVRREAVPRIIGSTRNVTEFRFTSRGVYNVGLPKAQVERVTRKRIETVNIVRTTTVARERVVGSRLHIYSPAPFRPPTKSEREVIRRERVYQRENMRQAPAPSRPREQMTPPRTRTNRNEPAYQPRGQSYVRPRQEAKAKVNKGKPERVSRSRKDNGPGKRR